MARSTPVPRHTTALSFTCTDNFGDVDMDMKDAAIANYRSKLGNAIKILIAHGVDFDLYSDVICDDELADMVLYCAKHHDIKAVDPLHLSRKYVLNAHALRDTLSTTFKKTDTFPSEVLQVVMADIRDCENGKRKVRLDAVETMKAVLQRYPQIKSLFS